MGQRDYRQIFAFQGQCYYPAGHLIFYTPFYLLYTNTVYAEFITKAFFILLHSQTNYYAGMIAFRYFQKTPKTAQLIVLQLLANESVR